jgi:hypothetical protein
MGAEREQGNPLLAGNYRALRREVKEKGLDESVLHPTKETIGELLPMMELHRPAVRNVTQNTTLLAFRLSE